MDISDIVARKNPELKETVISSTKETEKINIYSLDVHSLSSTDIDVFYISLSQNNDEFLNAWTDIFPMDSALEVRGVWTKKRGNRLFAARSRTSMHIY
jgi:hypothetical protein